MPVKGTTTARGYGWRDHQKPRLKWEAIVNAGDGYCAEPRCLYSTRWIPPGTPWDLAHDPTGTIVIGVAHRRCNRSEAATRGNRLRGIRRAIIYARRW